MPECYCGAADARKTKLPDVSEHYLCEDCEMQWRELWSFWAALAPRQANHIRKEGLQRQLPEEPEAMTDSGIDDGRRMHVVCQHCDSAEHVTADIDAVDDMLILRCLHCEEDILTGEIVKAEIRASAKGGEMDPRVYDPWLGFALAAVFSVSIWAVLLFVGVLLA